MVLEAPWGRLKRGKHMFKWFFAPQQWVRNDFPASVGGPSAEYAALLGTLLGGFPSVLTVGNLYNLTLRSQHGAKLPPSEGVAAGFNRIRAFRRAELLSRYAMDRFIESKR